MTRISAGAMRVGLDARALTGRFTGDRTYWRGLLAGLAEIDRDTEYFLYTRYPYEGLDLALPDNFTWHAESARNDRTWPLFGFREAIARDRIDVCHVQYTVPPFLPCPCVTTVHDITFRLFPELFSLKDRLLLNLTMPGSLRRARSVITVSENTRRDLLRAYPFVSPAKVSTTFLAADSAYRLFSPDEQEIARALLNEKYGLDGPYVLSVGVLQPRKNLPMLARAFKKAKDSANLPHVLAVAGKHGWLSAETDQALVDAGKSVQLLGYVADEDLPALYACADTFAYPSLYEGFGLPPLEAMACGCPVLASNTSSMPEVAGDAAILLDPRDERAWTDALIRILTGPDERDRLRALGLKRAQLFRWTHTADETRKIYRNACTH